MAGRFSQYSSSSGGGLRAVVDHDKYLAELLGERQKLGPFMQVLPGCTRLLNQEIIRVTALVGNSTYLDSTDGLDHGSPVSSNALLSNGAIGDLNGWGGSQLDRPSMAQVNLSNWHGVQGNSALGGLIVKKTHRIDVPIDKHPNYNFVGRILGPRGHSLKRVEATTGCRVLIRGKGSIKDGAKEEKMRDKAGFEHLKEPLHLLVEAELPASIIDIQLSSAQDILEKLLRPVDDTVDVVKKTQLRELAVLNGTLRDAHENPAYRSATQSHHKNPGMKRVKTQR